MFRPESMTTSEFIIGHSVDDAQERKQELRKIFWAVLAALFIHLLVGYSIATWERLFPAHAMSEEDKPMELTLIDLPKAPAVETKKNTMFMETPDDKKTAEPPPEKTFESNANSRAASEQAATGDLPMPSQQGVDRPNSVDLETHQYSLANPGAVQPRPSAAPEATPQESVAPTPQPTAAPDQFAMLRSTPTPTPETQQSSKPEQQASSYQQYRERSRLSGRITTRGISSVNALGTPLGRYQKLLFDSIGSRWYAYVEQRRDLVAIGTTRVTFIVSPSGEVRNLRVVENTANAGLENVCLQSVQEAKLPPMPEELVATLPPEGLTIDIPFTIFAN